MKEPNTQELLDAATEFARLGGRYALDQAHRRGEVHQRMANDIKLQLDLETQARIEEAIQRRFPGDRILGEEGDTEGRDGQPRWIVDPIDGTVNFSHGLPMWCCAVAVEQHGTTLAGAVYIPVLDECYHAAADGPARCNDRDIRVGQESCLDEAILVTGLPKDMRRDNQAHAYFRALSEVVQRPRIFGSAAIDLCFTAAGRCDIYLEHGVYLWDIAAGQLILQRAGGRCEIIEHLDDGRIGVLGANAMLFDEALSLARQARATLG